MRRMPHVGGGWSGDSRTASGFSGAPRIAPRKRRGRTKTGTARGGAQTRTGRPRPRGYVAPNPSKINGSIFIILGSARRADPEGEGAKWKTGPADGEQTKGQPKQDAKQRLPPRPPGCFVWSRVQV